MCTPKNPASLALARNYEPHWVWVMTQCRCAGKEAVVPERNHQPKVRDSRRNTYMFVSAPLKFGYLNRDVDVTRRVFWHLPWWDSSQKPCRKRGKESSQLFHDPGDSKGERVREATCFEVEGEPGETAGQARTSAKGNRPATANVLLSSTLWVCCNHSCTSAATRACLDHKNV